MAVTKASFVSIPPDCIINIASFFPARVQMRFIMISKVFKRIIEESRLKEFESIETLTKTMVSECSIDDRNKANIRKVKKILYLAIHYKKVAWVEQICKAIHTPHRNDAIMKAIDHLGGVENDEQNKYQDETYPPLHLATSHGNLPVMSTLIKAGFDPNYLSRCYEITYPYVKNCVEDLLVTPLYIAVDQGNHECVKTLLENKADPNCDFHKPIIQAASKKDHKMIFLLLDHKAEICTPRKKENIIQKWLRDRRRLIPTTETFIRECIKNRKKLESQSQGSSSCVIM